MFDSGQALSESNFTADQRTLRVFPFKTSSTRSATVSFQQNPGATCLAAPSCAIHWNHDGHVTWREIFPSFQMSRELNDSYLENNVNNK